MVFIPSNQTFFEPLEDGFAFLKETNVSTPLKKQITPTKGAKSLELGSEILEASFKVSLVTSFFMYIFGFGAMMFIIIMLQYLQVVTHFMFIKITFPTNVVMTCSILINLA